MLYSEIDNTLPNITDSYENIVRCANASLLDVEYTLSHFEHILNKNIVLIDLANQLLVDNNIGVNHNIEEYKDMSYNTIESIKDSINVISISLYFSDELTSKYDIMSTLIELKRIKNYINTQFYEYNLHISNYKFLLLNTATLCYDRIKNTYYNILLIIDKIVVFE